MSFAPFKPPANRSDARPAVVVWFRAYALLVGVASLVMSGLAFANGAPVLGVACTALFVLYGVAACVPYRPWGWTLALLAIGLGLAGVTIVMAVPLLLLWFKPVTKAAFARL